MRDLNSLWRILFPWEIGDKVIVINARSAHYGRVGVIKNTFSTLRFPHGYHGIQLNPHTYVYFRNEELERIR